MESNLEIRVKMNVCNVQDPSKCTGDIEAVVDNGSANTWIPRKKAIEIDLREVGHKKFRTINGEIVERAYGFCLCTVDGTSGGSQVVFGEDSDAVVLGALTMQALGITIDPKTGRMTKEDVFLAYRSD